MEIFIFLSQAAMMADSRVFTTNRRVAGKPTGKGNNTTDITKRKAKKKKYGEKKLSKRQRKRAIQSR